MDIKAFVTHGFVPFLEGDGRNFITDSTGSVFSASHTLEYSFSAFAAAQLAKSPGRLPGRQRDAVHLLCAAKPVCLNIS